MKKFKYRLETLLKVKTQIEKEKQREHAEALRKTYEQKELLNKIDRRRQDNLERQRHSLQGAISVVDMLLYTRYLLKLKKETMAGNELLRGLQRTAEGKRQALVKASREKKIYEKLKERQQIKYNERVEKSEKKELDEIATNNYCYKHRK
ncbi:MAG: flagellar export protein FliJ [candidate division Zixibacteria bacterium]|nr:flagellar export protein FliJ [candidate division Zixibacteria bacterium]MDD5426149.1 flagellar export protein FliJ [candidate division Zixibacteria bacterium]